MACRAGWWWSTGGAGPAAGRHLDLPAIEQLESALDSYPGTLLLVTHDRRMLEAVHLTRMITLDAGAVVEAPAR